MDATRRFGLLRSWVRVGLEVGRGHGGCRRGRSLGLGPDSSSEPESEPQSEAGPYQIVLGRERWPGQGDWPGFKWLARFQAELLRVMPVTVCRDSVTDLNLEVGHGHGWPGRG